MSGNDHRAEPNVLAPLRTPKPTATADEMRTYFHQLWCARAEMHAAMVAGGLRLTEEILERQRDGLRFATEEAQAWFRQIGAK